MKERIALASGVNFSVDDDDVWWLEVPSRGLTVIFSVDTRNQGTLFDENDNEVVFSGTSTFAVLVKSNLAKARALHKMIGGEFEIQAKISG